MLRQATRVCAFCEVRSLLGTPRAVPSLHARHQTRLYTQVQREPSERTERERERERSDRPRSSLPPRSRPPPRHRDGASFPRDGASFNSRLAERSRQRPAEGSRRPAEGSQRPRQRPEGSRQRPAQGSQRPAEGSQRPRQRPEGSRQRPTYGRDTLQLSASVDRAAGDKAKRKPREPYSFLNKTRAPPMLERERGHADHEKNPRGQNNDKRRTKPDAFHALKMQRSLHEIPYASRKAALAIPALLGLRKEKRTRRPANKSSGPEAFLLAAETGSGKTLAYLLPTLDAIKREEAQDKEDDDAAALVEPPTTKRNDMFDVPEPSINRAVDPARPRAVILVPSAELVAQVGAVAKSLSHTIKFRAAPISAKMTATVIRNRLFNEHGVDVVISTPPLLASIAESNPNILARVTHLICDEADSLFDRSFKPSTTEILDRATPSLKQLVLCSATIPKYLDKFLLDKFPDMHRLVTPNLHAIPRRVQLGVVDVNKDPYRGNKMLACADSIWQIGKSTAEFDPEQGKETINTKRILVFVNEREDTEAVAAYLCKKGIDALAFHRDTDPVRQAKTLASFTDGSISPSFNQKNAPDTDDDAPSPTRSLPNTKVIVTTDLGSRGIDTVSVRHVILYDVPHTTIDFIHRLGRTGRMGRRGRGIVLLGAGDRADVVREVREAMFRGEALI
ncbi:hypothetical protein EKO04_010521 [Ascochyta lentis]|uniref:RNA helicase n=1 Tax=Ascochyta lentis TaxID=205686 RepID=A0A8H7MEB1_9PLEO|nr:hypothetical protein EKO04_010521 [Ascochyta lentis]